MGSHQQSVTGSTPGSIDICDIGDMIPSPSSTPPPRSLFSIMDYNLTELKFEDQSSNDSESSSVIWVILFTLLMILSVLSNAIYIVSLATRKVTTTRIIISCFFVINLLDYSLIIFEFSLGPDNQFSYTDMSCALYQLLLQLSPMLSSAALLLLVLQASLSSRLFSTSSSILVSVTASLMVIILLVLPTLLYSEVAVYPSSARHCVVDMSGVGASLGLDITRQHITTAIYNMIYKAALIFVLPLVKVTRKYDSNKANIDLQDILTFSLGISFIMFSLPHAALISARQCMELLHVNVGIYFSWILKVLQSFFQLLRYFFHVFRPMCCIILDAENLKRIPRRGSYKVLSAEDIKN